MAETTRRSVRGSVGRERPGRFIDDYLLYLLARASHAASAQFHARLAARGISVPVWRVLASLEGGPMTVGDLARAVLLKQPTLTKVLDRLVASGLAQRSASSDDRRRVFVAMTQEGERLVADLLVEAKSHEAAVLSELDPAEVATLTRTLRHLVDAFDQPAAPPPS